MKTWRINLLGAFISAVFLISATSAYAADISIPAVTGAEGDTITVRVLISNAPDDVQALGVEVAFDNNVLSFQQGNVAGTLVEGFTLADANVTEATPGVVILAGIDSAGGFAAGTSGTLMNLIFEVLSPCGGSDLTLQALTDGMSTWTKADGSFSCSVGGACVPSEMRSCDTVLPGICTVGTQTCDGTGNWGECVQDNQPGEEVCGDGIDNNCDGEIDESCGECVPSEEVCDGVDNDCDGEVDEECVPLNCSLKPDNMSVIHDQIFITPIRIINAPNSVAAFTFDVTYDSQALEYQSFQRGDLAQNLDLFDVTLTSQQAGTLRVSGVEAGSDTIPQGSTDVIVLLTFRVLSDIEDCTTLSLSNLTGEMEGWGSCNGEACVTEGFILGDVDGDEDADIMDVLCLYQSVIGQPSCLDGVPSCSQCDIDGDEDADIMDVLCLYQSVIGQPSCLDDG